ncbi:type IV pilin N-terminal domain-containing protein [Natronomonas halophila]|uniref:type IV pilin n=1 Tax=Natronomonas halophila TaxID=2747817 RepID=UPI0015B66437|nr:type IV pilin N-terminal domain-containing protein [Natronomonas halophila]QLD87097.1 type IV pilin N-terminal domain-containing protein [Natronomonas halophila]
MTGNERAVSPVVATALLIGITVLLATTIGMALFDGSLGEAEAPEVTLSFEVDDTDRVHLRHEGGDRLAADEVVVLDERGNELAPGLSGDLTTGERSVIVDDATTVEEVTVVWRDPDSDTTSVLATFEP